MKRQFLRKHRFTLPEASRLCQAESALAIVLRDWRERGFGTRVQAVR